jgi:hypothetical protein
MKVANWNQHKLRRQARMNGGRPMLLGNPATVLEFVRSAGTRAVGSDRIRMDCWLRYVKAQLQPRPSR